MSNLNDSFVNREAEIEPPVLYTGGMFGQRVDVGLIRRQRRYNKMEKSGVQLGIRIEQNGCCGHADEEETDVKKSNQSIN